MTIQQITFPITPSRRWSPQHTLYIHRLNELVELIGRDSAQGWERSEIYGRWLTWHQKAERIAFKLDAVHDRLDRDDNRNWAVQ